METDYILLVDGRETFIQERDLIREPHLVLTEVIKADLMAEYEEALSKTRPNLYETPQGAKLAEELKSDYWDFLKDAKDGDVLCDFNNFPFSPMLCGRAGEVILRDNKIVSLRITMMS
jgi:hypothetical protein